MEPPCTKLVVSGKHWAIDGGVLTAIERLVPKGSTVLELGSGDGTAALVERYTVYSVEDEEAWVGHCEGATYIHAPFVVPDTKRPGWYDVDVLRQALPERYDVLLIDGPAGHKGREGILHHVDLFRTDVPIIVDDTVRSHEADIARELAMRLNRPMYVFWNFSVIPVEPLTAEDVARIQWEAVRVLEKKDRTFVKRYFTDPTPARDIDRLEWHEMVNELRSKGTTNPQQSFSLRVGRVLTFPGRFILGLFRNRR